MQLRPSKHLKQGGVALVFALLLGGAVLWNSTSAQTQNSIQVHPLDPKLGYTISVLVNTSPSLSPELGFDQDPPVVLFNQQTYPAFAIRPGQWRALVPTTPLDPPGSLPLRVTGSGGLDQTVMVTLQAREFPVQRITLSPQVASLEATELELNRIAAFKAQKTPEKYWQGSFLPPSKGGITSVFGVRRYYNGKFAENYYHRGIDYGGGVGSPVTAPGSGQVILVGREAEGFKVNGNTVGINHGQGVTSIFLHLSRIDVKEGDWVKPGQVIGGIGSSGIATGPHLHWGFFVNGVSVDPVPWLYLAIP
jgi:lysostaphin